MNKLDITAAVSVHLYKQPCTPIFKGLEPIRFENIAPTSLIDSKTEETSFLNDTCDLLNAHDYNFLQKQNPKTMKPLSKLFRHYHETWGTLFPTQHNETNHIEILLACNNILNFMDFFPKTFCQQDDKDTNYKINSLIESVKAQSHLIKHKKIIVAPAYIIFFKDGIFTHQFAKPDPNIINSFWVISDTYKQSCSYPLFNITCTLAEITKISETSFEDQVKWYKTKIFDSLARYITTELQKSPLQAKYYQGEIVYYSPINNRLLYFLMKQLSINQKLKECSSPICKRIVPAGKKYCSDECANYSKNHDEIVKIKSYIRTKKNRNEISKQKKDFLYKKVNDMKQNEESPSQIREYVINILKEGVQHAIKD